MMKIKIAAILLASAIAAVPAAAVTVTYSFLNVIGNVAGTVTGHIDGLIDNATSTASAVWVDSFPVGLDNGTYTTPFNVFNWSGGAITENSFTLSGGVITAAFFTHTAANGTEDQLFLNSACGCTGTGHTNFLDIGTNDARYVWNDGNLNAHDGLVFGTGNVPEPASWALLVAGFGIVGAAARRRSRGAVA